MRSKAPQPLPERLAPHDPNVPGVKPKGPPPPMPISNGSSEKEECIVIEEAYITIAETANGFIVTTPHSSGERTSLVFEQRENDDCMVKALISAIYDVIDSLGHIGSKHDTCRIKVSCENKENEDA